MRRRDFLIFLAGAMAAWPLAARAQPPGKIPRLGVLLYSNPQADPQIESFRRGLRDPGTSMARTSPSNIVMQREGLKSCQN
jgi:putative tryptophan/tyrosine transport system substrate-binding protein